MTSVRVSSGFPAIGLKDGGRYSIHQVWRIARLAPSISFFAASSTVILPKESWSPRGRITPVSTSIAPAGAAGGYGVTMFAVGGGNATDILPYSLSWGAVWAWTFR